jgi:hypothetical protein
MSAMSKTAVITVAAAGVISVIMQPNIALAVTAGVCVHKRCQYVVMIVIHDRVVHNCVILVTNTSSS